MFVSGGGSNFKAIQAAIAEGSVHGEVAVVVSNAPTCGGAEFARAHGIPVVTYPAPKSDPSAGLTADQLVQQLTQVGAAAVGCAGGMQQCRGQVGTLQPCAPSRRRCCLHLHRRVDTPCNPAPTPPPPPLLHPPRTSKWISWCWRATSN